jgi:hypothetical protein
VRLEVLAAALFIFRQRVSMFLYMFVLTLTTVEADLSWDGADSDKA